MPKCCPQPNYCCCKKGTTGEKGEKGPTGPTGLRGPSNENFVFGWTGISGNSFGSDNRQYWLIPGGQIGKNPYLAGNTQPVPSMAVAYGNATITHAAIHISGDPSAWAGASPQFTFRIYSFCEVGSGVPQPKPVTIPRIEYKCTCIKLDSPITAGCAERQALAVSVTPQQDSTTPANPISISIALYSKSQLNAPEVFL